MSTNDLSTHRPLPSLRWDVFCQVIDNLGDAGVCWRFCADLASRGHQVRLWIDQPEHLAWMVPGALLGQVPGIQVLHWTQPLPPALPASLPVADVWVETFGCHLPPEIKDHLAAALLLGQRPPVWLNLEYMSAESYVERSHRLPSPIMSGPLKGLTTWFFYPGFTPATGGLLREADLTARQAAFDAPTWLRSRALPLAAARRVSLFCYEPSALPVVLRQASQDAQASDWLVTSGRASLAVAAAASECGEPGPGCRLHTLPALTQRDYDHLLWSCDLNLVRGEDSLVRALWAGRPFVWHIYPQHDDAHHAKLEAFLDWLQAPPSLRTFHRVWNGIETATGAVWPGWSVVDSWRACAEAARQRLLDQTDLTTQLLGFVAEKR
ncbi:elongation factor P maturation arginine rhamnosyltransferase EarP [Hydrogenophaga taeniospiralis]|uniref:elongation factor P maturation arginine rhamnosyltransferase EarP n=1 Tax=Hydrogenophaga taeniospiralis TaxID=65656 RepID=UPI001CFC3804|nr:elongation factor P maturation arginine rhamnosyltransferase EarP [Hydrogenophaga taeniospiralis]MCB4364914.1 elongation factor P maturation arginine rhamnosyltransferase EarP [Hydrogenophaga taeniospiralis]